MNVKRTMKRRYFLFVHPALLIIFIEKIIIYCILCDHLSSIFKLHYFRMEYNVDVLCSVLTLSKTFFPSDIVVFKQLVLIRTLSNVYLFPLPKCMQIIVVVV